MCCWRIHCHVCVQKLDPSAHHVRTPWRGARPIPSKEKATATDPTILMCTQACTNRYAVAALGSGTTFLSALSTAIGMRHPIGIAMVRTWQSASTIPISHGTIRSPLPPPPPVTRVAGILDHESVHFIHSAHGQGVGGLARLRQ